jgi:hypothetical protein
MMVYVNPKEEKPVSMTFYVYDWVWLYKMGS